MAEKRTGRPTLFKPEFIEQSKKLLAAGWTDVEIADFFGIVPATLYLWKNAHPGFLETQKSAKQLADERVVKSLYAKAMGYEHDVEKLVVVDGVPTKIVVREKVPPSDTAMIFWLKNRQPAQWRDRKEVESDGAINVVIKKVGDG